MFYTILMKKTESAQIIVSIADNRIYPEINSVREQVWGFLNLCLGL